MSIATQDMKHGMPVTIDGDDTTIWDVLDRSPRAGEWWLHRWEGDVWHTKEVHQRRMNAACQLSAPLTRTDKWKKGPFHVTSRTTPAGYLRVQGHVVGIWGVHRNESKTWTLTHLPTGLSVPVHGMVGHNPTAADMRRVAEHVAQHLFPLLANIPFGGTPTRTHQPDMEALKALVSVPLPALVTA